MANMVTPITSNLFFRILMMMHLHWCFAFGSLTPSDNCSTDPFNRCTSQKTSTKGTLESLARNWQGFNLAITLKSCKHTWRLACLWIIDISFRFVSCSLFFLVSTVGNFGGRSTAWMKQVEIFGNNSLQEINHLFLGQWMAMGMFFGCWWKVSCRCGMALAAIVR